MHPIGCCKFYSSFDLQLFFDLFFKTYTAKRTLEKATCFSIKNSLYALQCNLYRSLDKASNILLELIPSGIEVSFAREMASCRKSSFALLAQQLLIILMRSNDRRKSMTDLFACANHNIHVHFNAYLFFALSNVSLT